MPNNQSTPPAPPLPNEPPGPGGPPPTDPPLPDPDIQPSLPPDGPQIIPSPSTPPGEPGPDPQPDHASDSGSGPGMGVSSERVPADPGSIQGTGSRRTATANPDGTWPTVVPGHAASDGGGTGTGDGTGDGASERPHPQDPAEGPDFDPDAPDSAGEESNRARSLDPAQASAEWRHDQPAVNVAPVPGGPEPHSTVANPHPFDPAKNPGHTHG